jgi:hypothetical protein
MGVFDVAGRFPAGAAGLNVEPGTGTPVPEIDSCSTKSRRISGNPAIFSVEKFVTLFNMNSGTPAAA